MKIHPIIAGSAKTEAKVFAWSAFLMCALGAIFYCYEYYLRVAPSVMRPELKQAFSIGDGSLGVMVAYYYYAYVPLQIPVGLMMDRYGPRRILVFACSVCTIGTLIFAGTNALWIAKVGRFLIGFGSAFAYVGVLKIANLWLPRKYFALIAGLCTALGMFGAMSGEILMSKLVLLHGWKPTLYYAVFVGIVLTVILWGIIRDKPDQMVARKARASHDRMSILSELWEIVQLKQLWLNGIIGCLTFLPLTAFAEMWAIPFLLAAGLSAHQAAFGSSLVFLGFGLGSPMWGAFSDIICSRKKPLITGSVTSGIVAAWIVGIPPQTLYLTYALLFTCGFLASAQVLVFAVGNDSCHPRLSATTVSFTNMLVMCGGMFLQPLVGVILDHTTTQFTIEQPHTFFNYQIALIILPIGLLLAGILSILLKETYHLHATAIKASSAR